MSIIRVCVDTRLKVKIVSEVLSTVDFVQEVVYEVKEVGEKL